MRCTNRSNKVFFGHVGLIPSVHARQAECVLVDCENCCSIEQISLRDQYL